MYPYFEHKIAKSVSAFIPKDQIIEYKQSVIKEMKKLGASKADLSFVHDETIINSINAKRKPEDVAWAILQ